MKWNSTIVIYILAVSIVFAGCTAHNDMINERQNDQDDKSMLPHDANQGIPPEGTTAPNTLDQPDDSARSRGNWSGMLGNVSNRTGMNRTGMEEFQKIQAVACADKQVGDTCTMTTPRGDQEGLCGYRTNPRDGTTSTEITCNSNRQQGQGAPEGIPEPGDNIPPG